MTNFNWENEIALWLQNKRTAKPFQNDLIDFFQKAFDNTSQPEKSLFGGKIRWNKLFRVIR